ncbi:hypothetical protein [Rhodococcus tibetensis]|uniref:hypothetical protein n=1 Tax=Rhodococcus tibetensis TaxID=2965064 RepID=UPI0035AB96CC
MTLPHPLDFRGQRRGRHRRRRRRCHRLSRFVEKILALNLQAPFTVAEAANTCDAAAVGGRRHHQHRMPLRPRPTTRHRRKSRIARPHQKRSHSNAARAPVAMSRSAGGDGRRYLRR